MCTKANYLIVLAAFVTAFMLVVASVGETVCPVIVGNVSMSHT